ncbi:MAG: hypothetical protein ACUZ8O_02435 [Candidatus Anammoxibacter sp.]
MLSNNKKWVIRISLGMIVFMLVSIAYKEAAGKSLPPIGSNAKLYNGSGRVVAGLTKKDIDEFRKSPTRLDADIFDEMYKTGSIFEIENNTEVLIIDSVTSIIRHFIRVRILGGKHKGKTVWVVSKDITDVNDKELVDIKTDHTNNKTADLQEEKHEPQRSTQSPLQKKQFNANTGKGIILNESTKDRISGIYNIGTVVTLKYEGGVSLYKGLSFSKVAFKIQSGTKARIIDSIITPEKHPRPNIYKVEVQQGSDKYVGWVTAYVVYD